MNQVKLSCPLGHKCEETRDDVTHRCAWFTQLRGQNPQSGQEIDERACAISWLPLLLIENANTNRGTSAAVESFRNSVERGQTFTQQLLGVKN
jgi:hypothetical protein